MATVTTPLMTAEEFFEWSNRPENADRHFELENGEVVEMPSPGELHGAICWLISHILGTYLFKRGAGYVCSNDTGLVVRRAPDTVRGPDIMLFLKAKQFDQLNPKHVTDVPDLVVEVFSPTDRITKTFRRVEQYLARGVRMVWVVFPEDRAVHVCQRGVGDFPKVFEEADELTGSDVLPEFRCTVADLFALPGSKPAV
jgi:Uma2 family endonuclease